MNNASIVNIAGIEDKKSLHKILKEALDLPDYYGGNLDALYDMLTSLDSPKHLVLRGVNDPEPLIRTYIPKLLDVLRDSAEENPGFTYEIFDTPKVPDRRALVVCGAWEDAANLNIFLEKLNIPEITSRFVISCFTFSTVVRQGLSTIQVATSLADIMIKLDPAGIVIFSEMLNSDYLVDYLKDLAGKHEIPVFMMEHKEESCVNFDLDYEGGFADIVAHVTDEHKCRDIMMMAGYKGNEFSEKRIEVFKDVLMSRGIPFDLNKVLYGDFWHIPAIEALEQYFKIHGEVLPDAIICANDAMAIGITDHLINKGYKIPEDVIVTGFDDVRASYYHIPAITTSAPDYGDIARFIASYIDEWDDEDIMYRKTTDIKVGFSLKLRASCGCAGTSMEEVSETAKVLFLDNQDYFMHEQEMGRLTSQAITITDLKMLPDMLKVHTSVWKNQMFFVGLTVSDDYVEQIYSSWKDNCDYNNGIYNTSYAIPYQNEIMRTDSGVNYLLFSHLSSTDESFGYICTGADSISFRMQQRFEEMGSYLSSIIHSVINSSKLRQMNREMLALSELDYMTGLYNRRGFLLRLGKMVKEIHNKDKYINYVMMDLDNLKPINDTYGHSDGDLVIKALAYAIQTHVHKNGIASRFGGDEFAFVILSDEPLEGTEDDLRNKIEYAAQYDNALVGKPYKILASIGMASCPVSSFSKGSVEAVLEPVMNTADERMYADKQIRHERQNKGNA